MKSSSKERTLDWIVCYIPMNTKPADGSIQQTSMVTQNFQLDMTECLPKIGWVKLNRKQLDVVTVVGFILVHSKVKRLRVPYRVQTLRKDEQYVGRSSFHPAVYQ